MKKIKTMRIASVLLIAVLLTTSVISGTFAKYVTRGEIGDSARVAKFGVTISGSGTLFAQTYFAADAGESNSNRPGVGADVFDGTWSSLTVESSNGDSLVAPGTKNDAGLSLAVAGAPEVDVKVTLKIEEGSKDVWLAEGWFADRTTAATGDPFYNASLYTPIVYTLALNNTVLKTGTLAEIKDFLDGGYSLYVDANTVMSGDTALTYTLTWAWDFDDDGKGTNDKQDTLLGDIAAYRAGNTCTIEGVELTEAAHYNIDVNVALSLTVTQVD